VSFDWQFLVVTAAALWGAWVLLRPLLAKRKDEAGGAACPRCASGNACASKTERDAETKLVTLGSGSRASRS
jgi:hypothetical protein